MSDRVEIQAEEISRSFGQFADSPLILLAKSELSYSEREAFKEEAKKINEASNLWVITSYGTGMSSVIALCLGQGVLSAIFAAGVVSAGGMAAHSIYVRGGDLHRRLCTRLGVDPEPK